MAWCGDDAGVSNESEGAHGFGCVDGFGKVVASVYGGHGVSDYGYSY